MSPITTTEFFDASAAIDLDIDPMLPLHLGTSPQAWLRGGVGMYQDAAGTTPAVSGSPLHRWNDQGPAAAHAEQVGSLDAMTAHLVNGVLIARNATGLLGNAQGSVAKTLQSMHFLFQATLANLSTNPILATLSPGVALTFEMSPAYVQGIPYAYAQGANAAIATQPYADSNFHVLSYTQDHGLISWYADGVLAVQNDYTSSGPITGYNWAGYSLGGRSDNGSAINAFLAGDFAEAIFYNDAAHTAAQCSAVAQYLRYSYPSLYPKQGRLQLFLGNSLTDGGGFVSAANQLWPQQALTTFTGWDVSYNLGHGGYQTPQITHDFTTMWQPLTQNGTTKRVATVWEMRNHIVTGGATAAQAWDAMVTLCQLVRSNGYKVIVATMTPAADLNETARQAGNALCRANWPLCADALWDLGNNPTIGQPGQNLTAPEYTSDHIHFNAVGTAFLANDWQSVGPFV
jgi:lysophospholipase L1-like esterase